MADPFLTSPGPLADTSASASGAQDAHLAMFLRLLQLQSDRGEAFGTRESSPDLYLGHQDSAQFWELLGFRVAGHPRVLLGTVCFQRQESPLVPFARPSLAAYLTDPPRRPALGEDEPPVGLLEVLLPASGEPIPEFLIRLRAGGDAQPAVVDIGLVEFVFDFRFSNPSGQSAVRVEAGLPSRHFFRTTRGHVLSGLSYGLWTNLNRGRRFVAIQRPVQHTPERKIALPTLVVNRSFLSMASTVSGGSEANTEEHLPYAAETATEEHLLAV